MMFTVLRASRWMTVPLAYLLVATTLYAQEYTIVQTPLGTDGSTLTVGSAATTAGSTATPQTAGEDVASDSVMVNAADDGVAAQDAATIEPDYFTGALSGRYAITVPEGRGGLKPALALEYRTGSGNGAVGIGWLLEPGSIERQAKNGVRYGDDAYVHRTNGGAETLIRQGSGLYATEIAVRFETFEKLNGADLQPYWVVTDTRGTKREYGTTASCRVANPANPSQIFAWRLCRVVDTMGNAILYTYTSDGGALYLQRIEYTDSPALKPVHAVTFEYAARPDVEVSYELGFSVTTALRLKRIAITSGGSVMPSLDLGYGAASDATGRSLLRSVTVVSADGKRLPSTQYRYQGGGIAVTTGARVGGPAITGAVGDQCLSGDFNGDTYTDIACYRGPNGQWDLTLSSATGWTTSPILGPAPGAAATRQCTTGDLNADGRTDLLCYTTVGGKWHRMLGSPTGWDSSGELQGSVVGVPYYNNCFTGDINGDGRTDLGCWMGGQNWELTISRGDEWAPPIRVTNGPVAGNVASRCVAADFNGDAKTDITCFTGVDNLWYRGFSTGSGWTPEIKPGPRPDVNLGNRCLFADFNGDRRTDMLCYAGSDKPGTRWVLALATATGFDATKEFVGPNVYTPIAQNCVALDFNGDGRADVACYAFNGRFETFISSGDLFRYEGVLTGPILTGTIPSRCALGDFNADGKGDMACRAGTEWQVMISGGVTPDLLNGMTNSFGGTTSFSYTKAAAMPNTRIPFPLDVVSRVATSDGTARQSVTQIAYGGGYYDIGRRDYRGFRTVTITGPQSDGAGARAVIRYHQGSSAEFAANDPTADGGYMRGRPDRIRIFDSANVEVRQSRFFYGVSTVIPRFNPLIEVQTNVCENGDCSRETRIRQQYDAYGNVTRTEDLGDVSTTVDDVTSVVTYAYNRTKNIVSLPSSEETLAGVPGTGRMAFTRYFFDGTDTCNQPSTSTVPTRGLVTRIVRWVGNGLADIEERTAFDDVGNVVCSADPLGNRTTFSFDASRQYLLSSRNALGHTTSYSHYGIAGQGLGGGLYGLPRSITDPNGAMTTTLWDSFGRKAANITPLGRRVTWTYSDVGTPLRQNIREESGGLATTTYLDGLGRPIRTRRTAPEQRSVVIDTRYDERGLVDATSLPYFDGTSPIGEQATMVDALRRPTSTRSADGTRVTTCYGGGTVDAIDPNGHRTRQVVTASGIVLRVERYDGTWGRDCAALFADRTAPYSTTSYAWDAMRRLTQITDARGVVTSVSWDGLSRRVRLIDPAVGERRFFFDAAGNETGWQSTSGSAIFVQFDALHRPVQKDYFQKKPLGAGDVMSVYDGSGVNGIGRLTRTSAPNGVMRQIEYDLEGRILSIQRTVGGTTYRERRAYDTNGRLSELTYPDGRSVSYVYDGPSLVAVRRGATTYFSMSAFNPAGLPAEVRFGNQARSTFTYETPSNAECPRATFRLCRTQTVGANGASLLDLRYGYDAKGNVITVREPAQTRSFILDAFDRLRAVAVSKSGVVPNDSYRNAILSADLPRAWAQMASPSSLLALEEGYVYDVTDNITWKWDVGAYVYPAVSTAVMNPHAPRQIGGEEIRWDPDGNMIRGRGRSFAFNLDGRVVAAVPLADQNGRDRPGGSVFFEYDGDGARVRQTTSGVVTYYIGDLTECGPGGCVNHIFLGGKRVASERADGTIAYYHDDAQSSPRAMTDGAGKVSASLTYSSYGSPTIGSLPQFLPTTFLYGSQPYSNDAEIYVLGGRAYDPRIGRFLSPDSVVPVPGSPQHLNRYSYCAGNPQSMIDPDGHFGILVGIIIGAILGAATALLQGANWRQAALLGALTGGMMAIPGALGAEGIDLIVSSIVTGSVSGGISAEISGGNVALGALSGGLFFAAEAAYYANFKPFQIWGATAKSRLSSIANQLTNAALHGAAYGAAHAAYTGGGVGRGALAGARDWALGEAGNMMVGHIAGSVGSGTAPWNTQFDDGQFVYYAPIYGKLSDGMITFGNVTIDNVRRVPGEPSNWSIRKGHELDHRDYQTAPLGPAYLPAHALSLTTGQIFGSIGSALRIPGIISNDAHHVYGLLEDLSIPR